MRGLGTIINALAIVAGGVLGIACKCFLKESYQDTIIKATGFAVVFLGAAGTLSKMLTVGADGRLSIGAMAVIGSIQDGIYSDHSTLVAKAILDFIIVLIMASSMGKGCVFSFIPVAVLQGGMTALAVVLSAFMTDALTDALLDNISLVGNILIFCVGINLVWPRTIKVANLLPALLAAIALTGIV